MSDLQKSIKKIYKPKILSQQTKIVGWPRCYKRECPEKRNVWQTIRAMLF